MKIKTKTSNAPEIIYPEGAEQINHWIDNEGKEHFKEISHKKFPIEDNWERADKKIIYDSKENKIYIYYSVNNKTNQKRIKICISGECTTLTKNNYFELNVERFFASNNSITHDCNRDWLINIFKEQYAFDVAILLLNKKEITVKEFGESLKIKEQMARKHLNKFVKLGLLLILKVAKGKILYNSVVKEEKLKERINSF